MRTPSVLAGLVAAALVWAAGARAEDYALILTNRSYDSAGSEPAAASYADLAGLLRGNGFRVFGGQDLPTALMVLAAEDFRRELENGEVDRIVVAVSGRIVTGATDSWLLGRDYHDLSGVTVAQHGLSLGALNAVLGGFKGQGLMVVSPAWRSREAPGPGLRVGPAGLTPAPGVAVMTGPADRVWAVLADDILAAARPLGRVAERLPNGVKLAGYLPRDLPLGGVAGDGGAESDTGYWAAARDIDTAASYRAYLNRYPNGLYAAEARRRIAALEDTPRNPAEEAEKAIGLTLADRRRIQNDLTLLGFNTYGVDGIFGARSRAAISAYQASRNYPQTSYLTVAQVARIHREADARRAELRREDDAFWQRTGALGTEDGLRAYLDRYPDGIHADVARARLAEIERPRNEAAAWDRAVQTDTIEAYRGFLDDYPDSMHAAEARTRIAELERDQANRDLIEQAKAEEATVAGNPVSRMLVERSLDKGGFGPGPVDGIFDGQTRAALRAFQAANGLPETGYVTQATMLRLTVGILR